MTRGSRTPFKVPDGFARLLDAYNEQASQPLEAAHVRLHELRLLAGFYLGERDGGRPESELASERGQLKNALRRAERSG